MKIKYFAPKVGIFMLMIHAASHCLFMLFSPFHANGQPPQPKVESKAFNLTLKGLLSHSVEEIGVSEVKNLENYQILDTREWEEYQVSHIPGGKWVGYDDFQPERVEKLGLDKEKPVLLYCSVGYRSEKIGEKMKEMGYKNVLNLYGGIFEWSNAQKALQDSTGKSTRKVHAYSKAWGVWVKKGEKVY